MKTVDELNALLEYIDARITEKIREATGCDTLSESIRTNEFRRDLNEITIGVGDGSGNLFVHGSYESIKAVQQIILRNQRYARKLFELETLANKPSTEFMGGLNQKVAQIQSMISEILRG